MSRLFGVATLAVLVACGPGVGRGPVGHAAYPYHFDTLPGMVATSDVVVMATVQDVTDGRVMGPEEAPIQLRDVHVLVEETWYGRTRSTIVVETLGFETLDPEWRVPGTRVVLFLSISDDPSRYHALNLQAMFPVEDQDVRTVEPTDPLAQELADLSLNDFRQHVDSARQQVERGEVQPQQPLGR